MNTNFYLITCLTSLHMGSGDSNFSVIDNEVERDPITRYPVMNASGIKGALREHCEKPAAADEQLIWRLFGSPVAASKDQSSIPGALRFLPAKLLARPVQASGGSKAYYMTTTATALREYAQLCLALTGKEGLPIGSLTDDAPCHTVTEKGPIGVDGFSAGNRLEDSAFADGISRLLGGESVVVLPHKTFLRIPLPVTARNYLVKGESKNLWYEENVPAHSVFWMAVQGTAGDLAAFETLLPPGSVVQFGADASIGKGICRITKVV